jgi:hypothetical protein
MTMSPRTRTLLVLASAASLTLTTVSVAAATNGPPPVDPPPVSEPTPSTDPAALADDTHGAWVPAPAFEPLTREGCGSTLTFTPGDVDEVEYQAMTQADGTVRREFRGHSTADITRESDGAIIDELPNGGPGHEVSSADGLHATFSYEGPSVIYAFDEVEAAVFATEGLPPLFWYEEGNLTERVVFPADPEALTIESAEIVTDTMRGVYDLCDLLDGAEYRHGH